MKPVRKFNPGTGQSDQELIAQYVVRETELEIALESLETNIAAPSCQNTLVVGPRGAGKTMLLARVAAELRCNPNLSPHLLPVRLMEESLEVYDIGEFWLETLFHLALELEASMPDLARELRGTHNDLASRWREDMAPQALSFLLDASDRIGRRLVLLVENLNHLCRDADSDFGWALRGVLQTEPNIMLLGSATTRFPEVDDANEPFFEMFRILDLKPLSSAESLRLWNNIAEVPASKQTIRPLEIFTGGSPRLLAIMADFAQNRSLPQLMNELVSLIDNHTEYFRGHLERLPKGERRVYVALIDLWEPSSTGEIAQRARMDVRTTSTGLGRLAARGMVSPQGTGSRKRYLATERLYCIYYKLRRERDEAAVVHKLIRFMVLFYSNNELAKLSTGIMEEAARSAPVLEGIRRAVEELRQEGEPAGSDWLAIQQMASQNVHESQPHSGGGETEHALESARKLLDSAVSGELSDPAAAIPACDELVKRFGHSSDANLRAEAASALCVKSVVQNQTGEIEAAISTCVAVVERFGDDVAPEVQFQVASALTYGGVLQLQTGDIEAGASRCDELIDRFGASDAPAIRIQVVLALVAKGVTHWKVGKFKEAIATCDHAIALFGDDDELGSQALVALTIAAKAAIQGVLEDEEEAIATIDGLIGRFQHDDTPEIRALVALATTYKRAAEGTLETSEAVIDVCDILAELFQDDNAQNLQTVIEAASAISRSVQGHMGEPDAVVGIWSDLLELLQASDVPDRHTMVAMILLVKGAVQGELGQPELAIATADELIQRFGDSELVEVQRLVATALVRKGESEAEIGHISGALETCEELDRRLVAMSGQQVPALQWQAGLLRAQVNLAQGQHAAAMDAFRSAYAAFIPRDQQMISQALARVPILIEAGASERGLIETLTSDEEKCGDLLPFVVALRERIGEAVRAPVEVIEVATDIRRHIDARLEYRKPVRS